MSAGPALRLTGDLWQPNLDGSGNILVSDFERLPLNRWVAAETNRLDDNVPSPRYPTLLGNSDGSPSIVSAWCGAAYDYVNQIMYLSGGGHADSHICENGIYALSAETLRFTVARQRSPMSAGQYWNGSQLVPVASPSDPGNNSANSCMADGAPGASHTFDALEWIPANVMGNRRGGVLMFHYSHQVLDLDTGQYDTAWFNPANPTPVDLSYKMVLMDGWNALHARADFFYRLWDFAPSARSATIWSANSRGNYIKQFSAGTRIVYSHKMMVRMPQRREFAVLAAPGGVPMHRRVRMGQGFDSGNRTDWSAFSDPITLTSSDGSHVFFNTEANWRDQEPDTALFAAGGTYDYWGNCIWVQSNLAGGALYKISGLEGSTWTTQLVSGAAALTSTRNGTYHRCQVATRGASRVLIRVSTTTSLPEVCRIA
jgi:hypothetical protein